MQFITFNEYKAVFRGYTVILNNENTYNVYNRTNDLIKLAMKADNMEDAVIMVCRHIDNPHLIF